MKKRFLVGVLFFLFLFVTGCGGPKEFGVQEINFKTFQEKIDNKETFMLEVVQDGCSACKAFTPRFEEVLQDYKLLSYSINLTKLSEKERKSFNQIINVAGTPNVIFFVKGEEETVNDRIVAAVEKDEIIKKLKRNGYIEKEA